MESSDPRIGGGTYGSSVGGNAMSDSRRMHGNLTETLNQLQNVSSGSLPAVAAGERTSYATSQCAQIDQNDVASEQALDVQPGTAKYESSSPQWTNPSFSSGSSAKTNYPFSNFNTNDSTGNRYSNQYPYFPNQESQNYTNPSNATTATKDAGSDNAATTYPNSTANSSSSSTYAAASYPGYGVAADSVYYPSSTNYPVSNANYSSFVNSSSSSANTPNSGTYFAPNSKYSGGYTYSGYSSGSSAYYSPVYFSHQSVPGVYSGSGSQHNFDFRSLPTENPSNAIVVSGLPDDVFIEQIASFFGEFGALKMDRQKDPPQPSIQLLKKGEARIVFETHELAKKAVEYFQGKRWAGQGPISVTLAAMPPRDFKASKPYFNRVAGGKSENYTNNSVPSGRVEPYSILPYNSYPPPPPYCPGVDGVYPQIPNSAYDNPGVSRNFAGFKGRGGAPREGDWVCPECGNLNFKFRNECHQCNVPRPTNAQILMAVNTDNENRDDASSSSTLRIGDWLCPSCKFQNFARRDSCHKCYTAKPGLRKESAIERKQERSRASGPY